MGYVVKHCLALALSLPCVGSFISMEFIRFRAKYLVFVSADVTDIICYAFAVLGYI